MREKLEKKVNSVKKALHRHTKTKAANLNQKKNPQVKYKRYIANQSNHVVNVSRNREKKEQFK